jgi:amino acid transporter
VTPASSVFVIVPGVIQQAGTGAFLSMLAAALLSFPIALVYSELASAFPIAGGEYSMLGRTLGPAWGFAMLGLILIGNMLTPAVLALGAGVYIGAVLPGLNPTAVAIVIIVSSTIFGILHIRTNAWVTGIFLLLEILALLVLAGLGFFHAERSLTDLTFHPVTIIGGSLNSTPLALIGLATSVSVFAYFGFSSAIYFTEEMHEAPRLIGRTILWATLIGVLTELIPVLAVLMGAPDLKSLIASQSPFSDFVRQLGGDLLNKAISLSVAIAIINAVLATLLQNARFLFSTGRDTAWHASINDALTRTHTRFHSPWFATLAAVDRHRDRADLCGRLRRDARRPQERINRTRRFPHEILSRHAGHRPRRARLYSVHELARCGGRKAEPDRQCRRDHPLPRVLCLRAAQARGVDSSRSRGRPE